MPVEIIVRIAGRNGKGMQRTLDVSAEGREEQSRHVGRGLGSPH